MKKIFLTVSLLSLVYISVGQDKMFEFGARVGYSPTARFGELSGSAPEEMTIHGLGLGLEFNYLINQRFAVGISAFATEYDGLYNMADDNTPPYTTSAAVDYTVLALSLNFKAYINPNSRFSFYGRFRGGLTEAGYPGGPDGDGKPNVQVFLGDQEVGFGNSNYDEWVELRKGGNDLHLGLGAGVDINILPILGIFIEAFHYDVTGVYKDPIVGTIDAVEYFPATDELEIRDTDGGPNMFFVETGAYVRFGNKKF